MAKTAILDDTASLALIAAAVVGGLWLWNRSQTGGSVADQVGAAAGAATTGNPAGAAASSVFNAGESVGTSIGNTSVGQGIENWFSNLLCDFTGNCDSY